MVWLGAFGLYVGVPLPIAATCGLENTLGMGKIKLHTCTFWPVISDQKRTRKKVRL